MRERIRELKSRNDLRGTKSKKIKIQGFSETAFQDTDFTRNEKKLRYLEKIYDEEKDKCFDLINEINEYINKIPDPLDQEIFRLHHVNNLTFKQISLSIGGGNTEEGIKSRYYRRLKKLK